MPILPSADEDRRGAERSHKLLTFFALVFALSVPFWLLGAATGLRILQGLPVGALMAICPMLAALILVHREDGRAGAAALLKRAFDVGRIGNKFWLVPAILLMPAAMILTLGLTWAMGTPLPVAHVSVLATLAIFVAFFAAALGEELGWSAYAIDPMQDRWGALRASLLLGVVWAVWHIVPLLQAHRPLAWIAWWCLFTLALRVLTVWLYNNTGRSTFVAALFHAMTNLATLLVPALYDPRLTGPIVAVMAVVVTVIWGSRTLTRT
ncbi:MAG: CPBP family glutamic-type intramembrane protease [Parvibaculum sp.]|nr:CPBP family glutamic-type intramembrane protease [Parvibaculum sp.]